MLSLCFLQNEVGRVGVKCGQHPVNTGMFVDISRPFMSIPFPSIPTHGKLSVAPSDALLAEPQDGKAQRGIGPSWQPMLS